MVARILVAGCEEQDIQEFKVIPNNPASSRLAWATWNPITKTKQARKERRETSSLLIGYPHTSPHSLFLCSWQVRVTVNLIQDTNNWVCPVLFLAYLRDTQSPNPSPDGSSQHFPNLLFWDLFLFTPPIMLHCYQRLSLHNSSIHEEIKPIYVTSAQALSLSDLAEVPLLPSKFSPSMLTVFLETVGCRSINSPLYSIFQTSLARSMSPT